MLSRSKLKCFEKHVCNFVFYFCRNSKDSKKETVSEKQEKKETTSTSNEPAPKTEEKTEEVKKPAPSTKTQDSENSTAENMELDDKE